MKSVEWFHQCVELTKPNIFPSQFNIRISIPDKHCNIATQVRYITAQTGQMEEILIFVFL